MIQLVTRSKAADSIGAHNTILFRRTERYLFKRDLRPLSAIKDMIGSQATKGGHVLARFALQLVECGVWSDGCNLTAIEVDPSVCRKRSITIQNLRQPYAALSHKDCEDEQTCARLFAKNRRALVPPAADVPRCEGWIWMPEDAFAPDAAPSPHGAHSAVDLQASVSENSAFCLKI